MPTTVKRIAVSENVCFTICEELPHKLSWTHVCELVK